MLLVTFEAMITNPMCIFSIIFAAFGMAMILLAKRITKVVRKAETVNDDDKIYNGLKIAGVCLILLAFALLTMWGMEAL
ncbi:MAG: hypothetical protein ACI4TT_03835 [Christensenellales bacterium]